MENLTSHTNMNSSGADAGGGDAGNGISRARSETVYAGMVYRHFCGRGRHETIPPLLSGRLPYRYAVGRLTAAKFTVPSAMHEICQENH